MVLGELVRGLGGVARGAEIARANLGTLRLAVASIGAVWAGEKILTGLAHMVEAGRELNKELEKTKQLGGEFADTLAQTRRAAIGNSIAVPTTTPSENVRMAREIGTTIGHPAQALDVLPEAAKTAYVISHYTGESAEEITKNLARTADARGQIYTVGADGKEHVDPAKLAAEMEAAAKGLVLGGGFIKSSDLLQMARQGGAAAKGQTPEAFYATGVEAAIAMGASKLGTAETGLFQQFIGGTMTRKVAERLTTAGLLDAKDWRSERGGAVVMAPTAAQKFTPMMKDPVEYLTTGAGGAAIKSYAASQGIDVMMAIFQLFGRQTVQRLVSEVTSNEPQFARAREIYGKIPSVDSQYKELRANDLDTNILGFQQAWKGLMEVLGETGVPVAIGVLHGLTDAIHFLTQAAAEHPISAQFLMGFVGLTGAILTLGGTIGIATMLVRPFTAAIQLLAGTSAASATQMAAANSATAAAAGGAAASLGVVVRLLGSIGLAYAVLSNLPPLMKSIADAFGQKALPPDMRPKHGAKPLDTPTVVQPEPEQRELFHGGRGAKPWHETVPQVAPQTVAPVPPVQKQSYIAPSLDRPESLVVPASYHVTPYQVMQNAGRVTDAAAPESPAASADRMTTHIGAITDRVAALIMDKLNGAKVVMDGRTVGALVMDQMARATAAPASATTTGFNRRMTPMPTGIAV